MFTALSWKVAWEFVQGFGKGLWGFAKSPAGQILIVLGLLWGAQAYGHHRGVAETNATWQIKWDDHLKADKEAHDKAVADFDARSKRMEDGFMGIIDGLQKKLEAEKKRPPIVKTVIKEVIKYVTPAADAAAPVPAGFVWYHNVAATESADDAAALANRPPGDVDAPSGVALSAVASTVAFNYEECRTRGVVLAAWQQWYLESKAEYEGFNRPLTEAEQKEFFEGAFRTIEQALEANFGKNPDEPHTGSEEDSGG